MIAKRSVEAAIHGERPFGRQSSPDLLSQILMLHLETTAPRSRHIPVRSLSAYILESFRCGAIYRSISCQELPDDIEDKLVRTSLHWMRSVLAGDIVKGLAESFVCQPESCGLQSWSLVIY